MGRLPQRSGQLRKCVQRSCLLNLCERNEYFLIASSDSARFSEEGVVAVMVKQNVQPKAALVSLRKPTRRDLLAVVTRLQNLIGDAEGARHNDRDPNRSETVGWYLRAALELCDQARSYDPPTETGPWADHTYNCR